MVSSQQPDTGPEGPRLYRPAKDRGGRLPSFRAIIIIFVIVLLGLLLFFRSPLRSKPSPSKQTSALVSSAGPPSRSFC